jgi:flavin reductase (DIM6/NTAB) family NADH-FMN oxidoreductase RutF
VEDQQPVQMLDGAVRSRISRPLSLIPQSLFIMTSAHETRMASMLVSFVQQASFDPPMVMVSLKKGRSIVPLIHGSRSFALNQIAADDRLVIRKYTMQSDGDDPLQTLETVRKVTGSPILARTVAFMDCQLVRHLDVESDHDIYIGLIREAGMLREAEIDVHLREDGFSY